MDLACFKMYYNKAIIIGGGMVGMALACALAQENIHVTLIDLANLNNRPTNNADGRASALAYSSFKFLQQIGAWEEMSKYAGTINEIRIVDNNSPLWLHFDHDLVCDEPMGYIVENRFINSALLNCVNKQGNIKLLAPGKYKRIEYFPSYVKIIMEDGEEIKANLLIAADGKNSKVRENSGIRLNKIDYEQSAIVCTVKHQKPHNNIAVEHFFPTGPFAILPMYDQLMSSLVWTEKKNLTPLYMKMSELSFANEVQKRFGEYLGKIEVIGERFSYPLSLSFAENYIATRMCLVGDSAHSVHPIAGQGLNLGYRDIEALINIIKEHTSLGLDIGSQSVLEKYKQARRFNNIQMIAATDILNRLFSNNIFPIKTARKLGLAGVNLMPELKKKFIKHAMGLK